MIRAKTPPRLAHPPRRAAIIVFVMIALLVATLLSAELVKMAGMSHRLIKRDEWSVQANRLAEAGCARALALLERDPIFSVDEWNISAGQMPSGQAAVVRIVTKPSESNTADRIILVVAEYPFDHPDIVRATRELRIAR